MLLVVNAPKAFRGNLSTSWREVQPTTPKLISPARQPSASSASPADLTKM
jgi:hypothetical protein